MKAECATRSFRKKESLFHINIGLKRLKFEKIEVYKYPTASARH